jgi:SAM-dependent methyltransferase
VHRAKTSLADGPYGADYFTRGSTYQKFRGPADAGTRLSRWYTGALRYLRSSGIDVLTEPGPVAEVGCGYGGVLRLLRQARTDVVGLDISDFALSQVRGVDPWQALVAGDVARLPFASGPVGLLLAFEVLEHIASPHDAVVELARVLRPGGLLVATTPNPAGDVLPGANSGRDPTHVSVQEPYRWGMLLNATHLEVTHLRTVWQLPWAWRFSSAFALVLPLPRIGPGCVIVGRKR